MNRRTRLLGLEALMIVVAAVFTFPLYLLVNIPFRQADDHTPPAVPTADPTLRNFIDAWHQAGLAGAITNSVIVTVVSVVIVVTVSSMAAYPLARVSAHWSRLVFLLVMLGLLLPFQLGLIPLYQTMRDLGLLGSVWSLVLFYSGLQVPFTIFLYVGFMRALPVDYEEAGLLDGARSLTLFARVVLPLLRPVTGTAVILNAIFIWNDFLTPLLYLSGTDQQTIPVATFGFVGQYTSNWLLVFAGLVIGIMPILAVYFLMQRRIIQGFAGGLKG
jgi:raffinose/stachyose/melibiose transport system permease protein